MIKNRVFDNDYHYYRLKLIFRRLFMFFKHHFKQKICMALSIYLTSMSFASGIMPSVSFADQDYVTEDLAASYGIDPHYKGELIVQYKEMNQPLSMRSLFSSEAKPSQPTEPVLYEMERSETASEAIESLASEGEIAYIEPNYTYHIVNDSPDVSTISTTESAIEPVAPLAELPQIQAEKNISDSSLQITGHNPSEDSDAELIDDLFSDNPPKDTLPKPLPSEVTTDSGIQTTTAAITDKVSGAVLGQKDKYFDQQWALKDIKAMEAWASIGNNTNAATVAVLDTGVDYNHPDLKGKIQQGQNFVKERRNGSKYPLNYGVLDDNGHGTFASGVIAAHYNNGIGVAGLAGNLNINILAVKVMNDEGEGNIFEISEGIRYAADQGVDIINLSLGGEGYSHTMANAVKYAQSKGVLVVAAAGNDGKDGSNFYPAAYPDVLTVGAYGIDDSIAKFSNYGEALDIMGPGVQIYSTSISKEATFGDETDGYYAQFNGTSFASPYVAGVAAIYKIVHPEASAHDITEALIQSATDLEDDGWDEKTGYGKVDMLSVSSANILADKWLKITGLRRNDYLKGQVNLTANLLKPQGEIDRVAFYLDKIDEKHLIAESNTINALQASIPWNTLTSENGSYELISVAYKDNEIKGKDIISIKLVNEVTNGILLDVKDPSGNTAVNAFVNVYLKDSDHNDYDRIFTGKTNELGLLRIPGTLGKDLSDIFVLIQGGFDSKDMKKGSSVFLYQRNIQGPGTFKITGENAQPVRFQTTNRSNDEMTDVAYYATVVDPSGLPVGTTTELNNNKESAPLIYLEPGSYDFFSYSKKNQETYFLTQWSQKITKSPDISTLLFNGQATGQVHLVTGDETQVKSGIVYLYNDKTNASLGMKLGGENIYVTSDNYRYKVDATVADPENKQDWIYTFDSGKQGIFIPQNATVDIKVGGRLSISHFDLSYEAVSDHVIEANKAYDPKSIQSITEKGTSLVKFPIGYELFQTMNRFSDAYGNFLCQISRGNSPSKLANSQGLISQDADDDTDEDTSKVLLPRFRVLDDKKHWVYPMYWDVANGHPDGEKSKNFFELTFWDVMSLDGKTGDYELQLSLEPNPLSPEKLSKKLNVRLYDDGIHVIKSYDPTALTKYANPISQLTVPYVYVYSLEKTGNVDTVTGASKKESNPMGGGEVDAISTASKNHSGYQWKQTFGSWGNKYSNETDFGAVALDSSIKLSKEKNGNLAIIRYTLSDDKSYIYLFRPFTTFDDLDTEIHLDQLDLKKATLEPFEVNGKALDTVSASSSLVYQLTGQSGEKMPIRMPIFTNQVLIEKGIYSFDGQFITHPDDAGNQANYYTLAKDIKMDRDQSVKFDASQYARINILPEIDGYKKWKGAALLPFSDYNHTFKIEESQGSTFYLPADIPYENINVVLGLADNEKSSQIWNYLLQIPNLNKLEAGKSYDIRVGGKFKPLLALEKSTYTNKDDLKGYSGVLDAFDNRLLSTRISANHEWFDVNRKEMTTTIYSLANNSTMSTTYAHKEDYVIQHNTADDANIVYPFIRLYQVVNGSEKVLYNEAKSNYYHQFKESLASLISGQYRIEIAFAGSPTGPVFTPKNSGLFTIANTNNNSNTGNNTSGPTSSNATPSSANNQAVAPKPVVLASSQLTAKSLAASADAKTKSLSIVLNESFSKVSLNATELTSLLNLYPDYNLTMSQSGQVFSLPLSLLAHQGDVSFEISKVASETFIGNHEMKLWSKPMGLSVKSLSKADSNKPIAFMQAKGLSTELILDSSATPSKIALVAFEPHTKVYRFVPASFTQQADGKWKISASIRPETMVAAVEYSKTFKDVSNHWAKKEIEALASHFIVKGQSADSFLPEKTVSRAEFISMLVNALPDYSLDKTISFKDVESHKWYADNIRKAAALGLVGGYNDKSFKPNQQITREEIAVIIKKAIQLAGKEDKDYDYDRTLKVFSDSNQIKTWSKSSISSLVELGILSGRSDKTYGPSAPATRAETAVSIYRLLRFLEWIQA